MAYTLEPSPDLLAPAYWGGHHIEDSEFLGTVTDDPELYLNKVGYRQAHRFITGGLAKALAGDRMEVTFTEGTSFSPGPKQLADGSIVVVEEEMLLRWEYDDEEDAATWKAEGPHPPTPPIETPHLDYWHANQTEEGILKDIGVEVANYQTHLMKYVRSLTWGVVSTEQSGIRAIQPFSFFWTKLLPNGEIWAVPYTRKNKLPRHPLLTLPCEIGVVSPKERLEFRSFFVDCLHRFKGIHVVHAADQI